jgi:pyruvate-formate lyase-activating enzyme
MPFRTVYFDIVGTCNARCPYCLIGRHRERRGKTVSVGVFGQALARLHEWGLIDAQTVVGLYNWGEPFLHPNLSEIVAAVNRQDVRYGLSTNASLVSEITPEFAPRLDHFIFSMPGFSQRSYDRIHGFDFGRIRRNIIRLVLAFRRAGYKGRFSIVYHVYRFNVAEIGSARAFAAELGVDFRPCYAILNDWWLLQGWLAGTLEASEARRIEEDLFCDGIRATMAEAPCPYRCPQLDYLVMDEAATVVGCCQLPKYTEAHQCGNVLTDDLSAILRRRESLAVCRPCVGSGLAHYLNTAMQQPLPEEATRRPGPQPWQAALRMKLDRLRMLCDTVVSRPRTRAVKGKAASP